MVFPVVGDVSYTDTFGDPRGGGRTHEGQDLLADKMTPVVAVAAGTVGWMHNEQGGNCCAMALEHDDGWASWYIHLNNDTPGTDDGLGWGFAVGIEPGVHVEAGQLIGFVGDSGNAEATVPHLHFELHDPEGTPANSYDALVQAPVVSPTGPPISNRGCDFDGDGMFDLAVGGGSGYVVYYGDSIGSPVPLSGDPLSASACGDVDNDSYDDLVVGSSSFDGDAGRILVHMGAESGLQSQPIAVDQATAGVAGAHESGDRMGEAVAVGDVDGDSYDDVVVGIPGEAFGSRADIGTIMIFWGSSSGIAGGNSQGISQATPGAAGGAETGDRFGSALTVGDFDADGFGDIAVGVPGEDVGSIPDGGAVHVFDGSASGVSLSGDKIWTQASAGIKGGTEGGDLFGSAVGSSDFDHDGDDELLIGVLGEDIGSRQDAGLIQLIRGGSTGLSAKDDLLFHQDVAGVAGGAEANDQFGATFAFADFDRDGWMDVAIGVPGEAIGTTTNSGAIQILFGFNDGPSTKGDLILSQASPGIAGALEAGDAFGRHLASSDLSADGYPDVVVGTPGEDVSGAADVGLVTVIGVTQIVTHLSHHPGQVGLGLVENAEFGVIGSVS